MRVLSKRRRRECKTDYLKRKRFLESGRSRIVVRKTNKYVIIQHVESEFAQDKVKVSAVSKELLEYGWPKEKEGSLKSLAAAYLTGFLFGKKLKDSKDAIVDAGLIRSTKGSRIYSAVKGIIDSGIKINCGKEIMPSDERISGGNSKDFFEKVKQNIGGKK